MHEMGSINGASQFVLLMVSPWVAFPSNTFGLNVVDASHASLNASIVWRSVPDSRHRVSQRVLLKFASALVVRLINTHSVKWGGFRVKYLPRLHARLL